MSIHRTPKSGLFLIELVVIILFFAITSAICANLFVNAHLLGVESKELNLAVIQVQTVAESVKKAQGDTKELAKLLKTPLRDGKIAIYYDENWNTTVHQQDACYQLCVTQKQNNNGMLHADVAIKKGEKTIYGVEVKRYTR